MIFHPKEGLISESEPYFEIRRGRAADIVKSISAAHGECVFPRGFKLDKTVARTVKANSHPVYNIVGACMYGVAAIEIQQYRDSQCDISQLTEGVKHGKRELCDEMAFEKRRTTDSNILPTMGCNPLSPNTLEEIFK